MSKVPFICSECGETKYVFPCRIKYKKYCSRECAKSGKNHPLYGKENKWGKQTEETKEKIRLKNVGRVCSQETKDKMSTNHADFSGKNNPAFIDGKIKMNNRWYIWLNNKRIEYSRYIAEKCLKRKLKLKEIIHHINGNCTDDRPENLYVFPNQSSHMRHHRSSDCIILLSNISNTN